MALILSAATGNFNAGATWVGGIVPGAADEARASTTHVITITANVTCTELSNAGTGTYVLNSGVTLTANVTHKGSTTVVTCLTFSAAAPATASIVGNITGGTVSQSVGVANSSTGTLTITGNLLGGSGSSCHAVNNTSTGVVNITGNATGGSGNGAIGAQNATGTLTLTGNATGGSNLTASGVNNSSNGTLNLIGTATGGSNSTARGANNDSTGQLNITGTAIGGTVAAGANNASSGTLNLTRAKGNAFGIGSVGLSAAVGVSSAQASITKVEEIEYGSLGQSPTSGPIYLTSQLSNVAIFVNYPTGTKTLSDPNNTAGLSPADTDVRSGVVYNNGNDTGTCEVPAAGSVGFGVPTDNTTGTATLTAADVRAALGMATANLDTQLAAIPTAITNANAVWDELMSNHTTSGTYGGRIVRSINSNNELQLTGSHHAAADVHEFQAAVIQSVAFATSAVTLFTGAMRTELTPELTEITEVHAIHGLDIANALTVTPTSRTSGAITQAITGDGTTSTVVTRV